MKKKILTILSVLALTSLMIISAAFAATADTARMSAAKYVPASAQFSYVNDDGHKYEVHFNDSAIQAHYEVEVNKFTGNVTEFKMESYADRGGNSVRISEAEVRNIVARDFASANIYKIKVDSDDGFLKYEVGFYANGIRRAEYEINPETGNIIEKDIKY